MSDLQYFYKGFYEDNGCDERRRGQHDDRQDFTRAGT